jgi:hypothetical protein
MRSERAAAVAGCAVVLALVGCARSHDCPTGAGPSATGPCDRPLVWTRIDLASLQVTSVSAVWGASATDVWVAAQLEDPTRFAPRMLHRDASGWTALSLDVAQARMIHGGSASSSEAERGSRGTASRWRAPGGGRPRANRALMRSS